MNYKVKSEYLYKWDANPKDVYAEEELRQEATLRGMDFDEVRDNFVETDEPLYREYPLEEHYFDESALLRDFLFVAEDANNPGEYASGDTIEELAGKIRQYNEEGCNYIILPESRGLQTKYES